MSDGLFIERDGFRTMLKWHRGHKQAGDISFTPNRITEGMALGASVEIDLVCHADGGLAVLHDTVLDKATTGQGPVRAASAEQLRSLFLRDYTGQPSPHRVMLIEDLGQVLASNSYRAGAVLQLDLKEKASDLTEKDIAAFVAAIEPVRERVILSAGDAKAVARLAEALPGLPLGYDPCHGGAIERAMESGDFVAFIDDAVAAIPGAEMIYLDHEAVLFAEDRGFNMVAAFHAAGKRIDAYTINRADEASLPRVLRLLALKCDQITTDDPVGLQALIERCDTQRSMAG
ncbi:glycerophosphodiester phosphodiesterase [Agrobacterium vitis]|uniref:glycerophosphodiester phosphodiesterase n=1 Tax=Agrobacterium vitis TaxID=373 RepID=UPI0008725E55|nr:glycerophosphodiester phosphodiesterase [Agrobacterium vitis]MCE6075669.1 glycerophosphodiester phosphodiesterase [Agrobacterium vitis]MCM2450209.1 glycerophosphodiester phosphodiesterase [Agrobacterium vitis]MCM2468147.1 glycerophosphodiester phosphodiesterase [Agrobacterium vitis]MUO70389.1 glycerophosphodiester phosphodiesterase [Agrobacterium vitis]MUO85438.1 glycerophosphodiester phosphodiesterase [Agrobacterium vitis]